MVSRRRVARCLHPEDRPDDDVGGHEEQDQRLDDAHRVDRQAALLLHQAGAGEHRSPQDRAEDDAEGVGAGEQRDGDGVEADADEHAGAEEPGRAGDLAGAGEPGEGAGDAP